MTGTEANTNTSSFSIECVLSASGTYIETLTIQQIEAQPWLAELVIKTQLLTARNAEERRVKARCCVDRAQLVSLALAINQFLEATGSSSEPRGG